MSQVCYCPNKREVDSSTLPRPTAKREAPQRVPLRGVLLPAFTVRQAVTGLWATRPRRGCAEPQRVDYPAALTAERTFTRPSRSHPVPPLIVDRLRRTPCQLGVPFHGIALPPGR